MSPLRCYQKLPKNLFSTPINKLHDLLKGPSLFHLRGKSQKTLFISTLLHGNETSGFLALKSFFKKYDSQELPISICLFIGNTMAAKYGQRQLEGQKDWNRVWVPKELPECPEKSIATKVLEYGKKLPLFASVDIHNNTGHNPSYSCINYLDPVFFKLAQLFNKKTVYFTTPHQALSVQFGRFCPSLTIEAGMPGEKEGIELILDFLEKIMRVPDLSTLPPPEDIPFFHTIGRIKTPKNTRINFQNDPQSHDEFSLRDDLDSFNFRSVPVKKRWGYAQQDFIVESFEGKDIFNKYFERENNSLLIRKSFTPCMLTKDIDIIQSDCLCYIMEKRSSQSIEYRSSSGWGLTNTLLG